jgi:prepilin-type N-terminal cleavage/methylation domain-containing protein
MSRNLHDSQKRRSIEGFTLIEMMMVTAIVGILGAIAVPNYLQWQARYQLKAAAMEVTNQLMASRFLSMTRNTAVTTAFSISSGQLVSVATNAGGTEFFRQATNLPKVTAVSVVGGGSLQFSSTGLRASGALGADQVIQLTNVTGQVYSVRLTQGGKASWCPKSFCP